ncbi:MAG: hypothetical protein WC523_04760 [Patescibacteria group bacterium]
MANLKRILDIYQIIKDRLPKTYPRAMIAFHENENCMLVNNDTHKEQDESTVFAVANVDTNTISLPLKLTIEYQNKKTNEILDKEVSFTQQLSDEEIASILLHELGHLYGAFRYGNNSKQYSDEKYCDMFADRWIKVFKKEKLI